MAEKRAKKRRATPKPTPPNPRKVAKKVGAKKKTAAKKVTKAVKNKADRAVSTAGRAAFSAAGGNRSGNARRDRVARAAGGVQHRAEDRISRRNTGQSLYERGYGPGGPSLRQLNPRRGR